MSASAAARPPPHNPIVLIPARMASQRLPGKPLADIAGRPMIVHVLERAEAAAIGPVVVACAEPAIADAVESAGGRAVLTRPDHASGSDRIFEALQAIDPAGEHDAVVNLQGDLPTLAPALPAQALALLADPAVDVGTLAAEIADPAERADPNVVKAVVSHAGRAAPRAARSISPARPRPRAKARSGTISASTPTGARRWPASSRSRPARWSGASGWSSFACLKTGCVSRSPSSTRSRSASIRRHSSRGRGR